MQQFKIDAWEGAALVRIFGPVSLDGLRRMRAEVSRLAMLHEVRRVLCDTLSAAILLGPREWETYSQEACSEHAMGVPIAYLVHDGAYLDVCDLCDELNEVGRIALAFTASAPAYEWLALPDSQPAVRREFAF